MLLKLSTASFWNKLIRLDDLSELNAELPYKRKAPPVRSQWFQKRMAQVKQEIAVEEFRSFTLKIKNMTHQKCVFTT